MMMLAVYRWEENRPTLTCKLLRFFFLFEIMYLINLKKNIIYILKKRVIWTWIYKILLYIHFRFNSWLVFFIWLEKSFIFVLFFVFFLNKLILEKNFFILFKNWIRIVNKFYDWKFTLFYHPMIHDGKFYDRDLIR